MYNARAQLLFYSLNLLFSDVLVAVVFVVCLSFLNLINMRGMQIVTQIHSKVHVWKIKNEPESLILTTHEIQEHNKYLAIEQKILGTN